MAKNEGMTAEEFIKLRESFGMTQAAFAVVIGRTVTMVSRYENGHVPITQDTEELIRARVAKLAP